MKFEEILGDLREGRKARRSAYSGQFKFVQFVDPTKYPGLDGDRESHQIMYRPAPEFPDSEMVPYDQPFDTAKEAKAALIRFKKLHTASWTRYKAYQKSLKESNMVPSKDDYVPMPTDKEGCFDDAVIETRGVLGNKRLGEPFLVVVTVRDVMKIWTPTHEDILASDWSLC